jgi:hypothetical protein
MAPVAMWQMAWSSRSERNSPNLRFSYVGFSPKPHSNFHKNECRWWKAVRVLNLLKRLPGWVLIRTCSKRLEADFSRFLLLPSVTSDSRVTSEQQNIINRSVLMRTEFLSLSLSQLRLILNFQRAGAFLALKAPYILTSSPTSETNFLASPMLTWLPCT